MKKIYAMLAVLFAVSNFSYAQTDTSAVHKAGSETIIGTKTFNTAPIFTGGGTISGNEWKIVNSTPSDGAHKAVFGNTSIYYGSRAGFLFQPSSSGGKIAQLVYQPSGLGDGVFIYQSVTNAFDRILTTRDIPVSASGSFSGNEWVINNSTPSDGAHKAVFGNTSIYYGSRAGFLFQPSSSGGKTAQLVYQPSGLGDGVFIYQSVNAAFDRILTTRDMTSLNGHIGIGTTTPDAKLAVNGIIHTKEVKVDLTGWSDYVFKPSYKLPTLAQVEAYIGKNGHLPGIPSAGEVDHDGIMLGEMNKLLLKKIEELTLYMLEKEKQLKAQEARISKLEKQATMKKINSRPVKKSM